MNVHLASFNPAHAVDVMERTLEFRWSDREAILGAINCGQTTPLAHQRIEKVGDKILKALVTEWFTESIPASKKE